MLKRLAEFYHVPAATFVVLALAGLGAFWAVIGMAVHAGLVELWPAIPAALAWAAAIVAPPVFVGLVAVAATLHGKYTRDLKTGKRLALLELLIPAAVVVYLVYWAIRELL
jgi:hypothetical protein